MSRHTNKRSIGFANPEPLLLMAALFVIAAILIPVIARRAQRAKDAALMADVRRIEAAEDAYHAAHGRWADTLAVSVSPGVRLGQFRSDSTGWSIVVEGDSGKAKGRHCAMFDGGDIFRPSGEVPQPRDLACW